MHIMHIHTYTHIIHIHINTYIHIMPIDTYIHIAPRRLQMMQILVVSNQLAALLYSITQLNGDVVRFLITMAIVLLAFAGALTSLAEPDMEVFG